MDDGCVIHVNLLDAYTFSVHMLKSCHPLGLRLLTVTNVAVQSVAVSCLHWLLVFIKFREFNIFWGKSEIG